MTMSIVYRLFAVILVALLGSTMALSEEIRTVKAELQQSGNTVTLGGTVVPYKKVVLSAQIPGQVTFIAGHEGDSFKAGAKLIVIDESELKAKRRAVLAQIMSARSALANASVQYNTELVSPSINRGQNRISGFGMPMMFDNFFSRPLSSALGQSNPGAQRFADVQRQASAVNRARSALLAAQAQLQQIDVKLRDAVSRAPFDGVIVSKKVEVGDSVQPGTPMMEFAYVKYLRIQAEVPVRLVSTLEKGMFVPARLDAGAGIEVMARVAQIFPAADAARHTVTVKFDLPSGIPGGPGMFAEVRLPDPSQEGVRLPVIPRAAIIMRGSLPGVYVLENGKKSLRLIRIGNPVGNGKVTVLSGLKGGEDVIINPGADTGAS